MSEIALPATASAAVPHSRTGALIWVRRIGYVVLGLQLIGFMAWSVIECNRFSLTWDYSINYQAWYLIAHGDLAPYSTPLGAMYWRAHTELAMWPLALLYWAWPHDQTLLCIQDCSVVGAEAVAFTWICEMAGRRPSDSGGAWFAAVGLVLLVANPWTWTSISFDFHSEPAALSFLMLLAWDLANARRRAWVWVLPTLMFGDVSATYLVGAALGAALANRQSRVRGLAIACVGLLTFAIIDLVHGHIGSTAGGLRYLVGSPVGATLSTSALIKGILTHPLMVVRMIASKHADIWANLAPVGLIGVLPMALFPVIAIVLLESGLTPDLNFITPGFQNLPCYILVPIGTVAVLGWLHHRHQITALVVSCLVVAQALAWTVIWAPQVPGRWVQVPADAAATLAAANAAIPIGAEVIASQGIMGGFANRARIYRLEPGAFPVHGETWFVITPAEGIEVESTGAAMALIGELAGPLGATLVAHANGVWVFRYRPPAGTTTINTPGDMSPIDAWVSPGAAGSSIMSGPVSDWHVEGTVSQGYVVDQLAWQVPTGRYTAEVTLATSGPVNVEAWDDTGNVLLTRRTVVASGGPVQLTLAVDARITYHARQFLGWGPFHVDPQPPLPGQRIEVRVWSPGGVAVNVYSAELVPSAKGG